MHDYTCTESIITIANQSVIFFRYLENNTVLKNNPSVVLIVKNLLFFYLFIFIYFGLIRSKCTMPDRHLQSSTVFEIICKPHRLMM